MCDIDRYLGHLNTTREDLRGKYILDVGAGYGRFAEECAREGLAKVVSVDNDLQLGLSWRVRIAALMDQECSRRAIPDMLYARSEYLPFQDEAFDLVIAHFSVPIQCRSCADTFCAVAEMCRVAKRGGELRIVPIAKPGEHDFNTWMEEELFLLSQDPRYRVDAQTSVAESPAFPGRCYRNKLWVIQKL